MDAPLPSPLRSESLSRGWQRGLALGILAIGMLVHAASLLGDFTVDDHRAIVRHAGVTTDFADVFRLDWFGRPFSSTIGSYRPVVTASFWLDYHLGGAKPVLFHLVNLLLYAGVLWTFDCVLARLTEGRLSAAVRGVALLVIATLTIHADVVPSATGRSELMSALFSLLALYAATDPRERSATLIGYAAALSAAMLSKETAISVAVLVPLISARHRSGRWTGALSAISALCFGAFVWLRVALQLFPDLADWEEHNLLIGRSLGERLCGAAEVLTHYLQHTLVPIDLIYAYGYAAIVPGDGLTLRALLGFAVAAIYVGALGMALRRRHAAADILLGLGASYAAVSQVLTPATELLADRWFFLPTFWLVAALALAVDAAIRKGWLRARLPAIAGVAFAAAQAALTVVASQMWHDDRVLARYSIAAHANAIGPRLLGAQAAAEDGRFEDAAWSLLAAYSLHASFPQPIEADAVPAEWETFPAAERVAALRARIGAPLFERVREIAIRHARLWPNEDVVEALAGLR